MDYNNNTQSLSSIVYVDFQYVLGNNKQIFPKELCFMQANRPIPKQYILKPPYGYEELNWNTRYQNEYNLKNINGLSWHQGDVEYTKLSDILAKELEECTLIIVVGSDKKRFLEKYITSVPIIDLEYKLKLKRVHNYITDCQAHDPQYNGFRCAMNHVFKIFTYMGKIEYDFKKLQ